MTPQGPPGPYPQQPYGPPPGYGPPHNPYGAPPGGPPPGYPPHGVPPQGMYVRLPGPIAGLDERFVQHLIDLVVMVVPYLVLVGIATGVIVAGATQEIGALIAVGSILYILAVAGAIVLQVYLQIFDAYKNNGQTYGMRKRGLRVVKADGSPLSQGDLAIRWLLLWLIDGGLVGLICIAATQQKQRLGDMAAKTLVVHVAP